MNTFKFSYIFKLIGKWIRKLKMCNGKIERVKEKQTNSRYAEWPKLLLFTAGLLWNCQQQLCVIRMESDVDELYSDANNLE